VRNSDTAHSHVAGGDESKVQSTATISHINNSSTVVPGSDNVSKNIKERTGKTSPSPILNSDVSDIKVSVKKRSKTEVLFDKYADRKKKFVKEVEAVRVDEKRVAVDDTPLIDNIVADDNRNYIVNDKNTVLDSKLSVDAEEFVPRSKLSADAAEFIPSSASTLNADAEEFVPGGERLVTLSTVTNQVKTYAADFGSYKLLSDDDKGVNTIFRIGKFGVKNFVLKFANRKIFKNVVAVSNKLSDIIKERMVVNDKSLFTTVELLMRNFVMKDENVTMPVDVVNKMNESMVTNDGERLYTTNDTTCIDRVVFNPYSDLH